MKYFTVWMLAFLFIFSSCKKEELSFEFSGNVKSLNNNTDLKGVEVKITAFALGNASGSLMETVETDENGNYNVKIKRGKYEKVDFSISKNLYFDLEKSYSFQNLSTSKPNINDFKISPKSWAKFIIRNIYSQNDSDQLKIQKVSGRTDCYECWDNTTFIFKGVLDTVVYCPNDGDTNIKFYYWLNDEELGDGVGNVYTTPFDTIPFEFIY